MKKLITLTLCIALVFSLSIGASAGFWKDYGNSWEKTGEAIGDFWESWGEQVGSSADRDSDDLANAVKDAADAAGKAGENVDIDGFFGSIGAAVKNYLGGMSKWFK